MTAASDFNVLLRIPVIGPGTWEPFDESADVLRALVSGLREPEIRQLERDFAQWVLAYIRQRVLTAVRTQQFPVDYRPLSATWVKIKREKGLADGFWRASGLLQKTLRTWRANDGGWLLGWLPNQRYPTKDGSQGVPVAQVAWALEHGVARHNLPPRPLFTPYAMNVIQHAWDFFLYFLARHREDLLNAWEARAGSVRGAEAARRYAAARRLG